MHRPAPLSLLFAAGAAALAAGWVLQPTEPELLLPEHGSAPSLLAIETDAAPLGPQGEQRSQTLAAVEVGTPKGTSQEARSPSCQADSPCADAASGQEPTGPAAAIPASTQEREPRPLLPEDAGLADDPAQFLGLALKLTPAEGEALTQILREEEEALEEELITLADRGYDDVLAEHACARFEARTIERLAEGLPPEKRSALHQLFALESPSRSEAP